MDATKRPGGIAQDECLNLRVRLINKLLERINCPSWHLSHGAEPEDFERLHSRLLTVGCPSDPGGMTITDPVKAGIVSEIVAILGRKSSGPLMAAWYRRRLASL